MTAHSRQPDEGEEGLAAPAASSCQEQAVRVTRVRSLRVGYALAIAAVLILAAFFSGFAPDQGFLSWYGGAINLPVFFLLFGALPALGYAWSADKGAKRRLLWATEDAKGLRVGEDFVDVAQIRSVWVGPTRTGEHRLRIERKGLRGTWILDAPSRETAWTLAKALGFGPDRRIVGLWTGFQDGYWLCAYVSLLVITVVAGLFGLAAVGVKITFSVVLLVAFLFARLTIAPAGWLTGRLIRIDVGRDGIRIRRWVFETFVPYEDVVDIVEERGAVRLCLRNGKRIPLAPPVDVATALPTTSNQRRLALVERIRSALERYRERLEDPSHAVREVHRNNAVPEADSEVYRARYLEDDELFSCLEDPAQALALRLRAARELERRGNERVSVCVEEVASTTVDRATSAALVGYAKRD